MSILDWTAHPDGASWSQGRVDHACTDSLGRKVGGIFAVYRRQPPTWGATAELLADIEARPFEACGYASRDGASYGAHRNLGRYATLSDARAACERTAAEQGKRYRKKFGATQVVTPSKSSATISGTAPETPEG